MLRFLRVLTYASSLIVALGLTSCTTNSEKADPTKAPAASGPQAELSTQTTAKPQPSVELQKPLTKSPSAPIEQPNPDTHVPPVEPSPKTNNQPNPPPSNTVNTSNDAIAALCKEIGDKLGSVTVDNCLHASLKDSGGRSTLDRAIAIKKFDPQGDKQPLGRVLLMGGIHGDEYSSVSIVFRWLETLNEHHSGLFEWMVVPLLNPDGLLRNKSQRQNGAGVDLNRNFPTPDWRADALNYWRHRTYSNPRRYPGPNASSEPETRWFIEQIELFKPDAILAVHAPHSLVDYDGPQRPPHKLGRLYLQELGIYPGSLGNYAGVAKGIPVVTIELSSAGIMPPGSEVSSMWSDLIAWLQREVPKQRLAKSQGSKPKE